MMRSFIRRRGKREIPALNTSSLPDLIFTVLFFFMIVTHMRDVDLRVSYEVPQGTELQKLGHKGAVAYIYIGRDASKPHQAGQRLREEDVSIQLNNRLATVADIKDFAESERQRMSEEDRGRMTVSIKADRDVPMGVIADVKAALQDAFVLKINYSATVKKGKNEKMKK